MGSTLGSQALVLANSSPRPAPRPRDDLQPLECVVDEVRADTEALCDLGDR